jgi:hypothetical protein
MEPLLHAFLKAKVDMKDVGEAMFVLLIIAGAFAGIVIWAKLKNKKRKR